MAENGKKTEKCINRRGSGIAFLWPQLAQEEKNETGRRKNLLGKGKKPLARGGIATQKKNEGQKKIKRSRCPGKGPCMKGMAG